LLVRENVFAGGVINNQRRVGDDSGQAFVSDRVNVIAASADSHRAERPGLRGFDDAVHVLAFRHWLKRRLFDFSTHIVLFRGRPKR